MSFANLALRGGAIKLSTGRLGTFPNAKRPRVLWIGLDGQTDKLAAVRDQVGAMLDRQDVDVDTGPFRPHLTLGRARDTVDRLFPYKLSEAFKSSSVREIVDSTIEFTVSEVVLYRSHLEKIRRQLRAACQPPPLTIRFTEQATHRQVSTYPRTSALQRWAPADRLNYMAA